MRTIEDVLRERDDLSTFVVHLTQEQNALANLISILTSWTIEARSHFGPGGSRSLAAQNPGTALDASQRAVCFTETPLHHVSLMCGEIQNRQRRFAPYGVAFPRTYARAEGINPVWYIDTHHNRITSRDWLINPIWAMIDSVGTQLRQGLIDADTAARLPIFTLTPFIETMGRMKPDARRYEFWWEREWRRVGDFNFGLGISRVVVLAPESEHPALREATSGIRPYNNMRLVDVTWSRDQVDGVLGGLENPAFPS